jgi:hypothetical protein
MFSFGRGLGFLLSLSSFLLPLTAQNRPSDSVIQVRNKPAIQLQRLPLAFEPKPDKSPTRSDYIVRSGLMFTELSATETRLYLPSAKNQAEEVSIRLEGANLASTSTASVRDFPVNRTTF